jgi:hypothetical protein
MTNNLSCPHTNLLPAWGKQMERNLGMAGATELVKSILLKCLGGVLGNFLEKVLDVSLPSNPGFGHQF